MANTAAHLLDRVVPDVPVRQWVLSFPFELRMLLSSRAEAVTYFSRVFVEEVFRWQRQKLSTPDPALAKGGAIAFHHRFGGSLNLHVHFHVCVLDGLYLREKKVEPLEFRRTPPPEHMDLREILLCVHLRVLRWLMKRKLIRDPNGDQDDPEEAKPQTALEACLLGSLGVGQLVALPGEELESAGSGALLRKSGSTGKFQFRDATGYSIHAGVVVHAGDFPGRERLFRYCSRPPLSLKRLSVNDDGQILYQVKGPRRGKNYRVMTPTQFMARLAALVPPPRHPLIRFHGVLAPHSADRKQIVPAGTEVSGGENCEESAQGGSIEADPEAAVASKSAIAACHPGRDEPPELTLDQARALVTGPAKETDSKEKYQATDTANTRPWRIDWATLLRRVYDVDVLQCPCGGRLRFVEVVTGPQAPKKHIELEKPLKTHIRNQFVPAAPPVLDG